MMKGTEIVGKGNLEHKIIVKSKNEIGQLANSFNKMTEDLQKVTVSRDQLEETVESRTEDLQKTINLMAGREVRMADLKGVIQKLHQQLKEAGLTPVADDPLRTSINGKS